MKSNRSHSVAEVEETLFEDQGLALEDYFIVGNLAIYWQKSGPDAGTPMAVLIDENDKLAKACLDYLRSNGAPEYSSIDAAKAARNS